MRMNCLVLTLYPSFSKMPVAVMLAEALNLFEPLPVKRTVKKYKISPASSL